MRLVLVLLMVFSWAVVGSGCDDATTDKSGGPIDTCNELCELAPVDDDTADCVSGYIAGKGYNTLDPACSDANTVSGCNICYDAIAVLDDDCDTAHATCF
jgi:hypothetical protein